MKIKYILMFLLVALFFHNVDARAYTVNMYESEPNNTKSTAVLLPYSWTTKKGNISTIDDQDWYKISIGGSASLTINFMHEPDSYMYNLFTIVVYNSNSDLLSQTDIYAPDFLTSFNVGLGEAGDYYIVIKSACDTDSGRCEYHHSDEYTLEVSVFNTSDYTLETEPNNNTADADNYINGGIVTGQISTIADIDYYVLHTDTAADIIVEFSHIADNYQYNLFCLEIFDSNGILLNSTDIYAPDDITRLGFSAPESGEYYFKVTGCQGGSQCEIHRTDQYLIKTLISFLDDGCSIAYDNGYNDGYTGGHTAGYTEGHADGVAECPLSVDAEGNKFLEGPLIIENKGQLTIQ